MLLNNDIRLHITGTQTVDNEETVIDFFVDGHFEDLRDGFVLEYTEPAEHDLDRLQTTVRYDGQSVQMERGNGSSLIIQQGQRHVCQYATPFGNMYFGISGGKIDVEKADDRLRLEFDYAIDLNTRPASHNKLKITARSL
ncbi:MAG: DUF1934 domain-containing protein [Clostridia bacterium]|nr:DUF1934 domain-containing protein [Clostridia bacterium]